MISIRVDFSDVYRGLSRYQGRMEAVADRTLERAALELPAVARNAILTNQVRTRRNAPSTRLRKHNYRGPLADVGTYAESWRGARVGSAVVLGPTGRNGRISNEALSLILEYGTRHFAPFPHLNALLRLSGNRLIDILREEAANELSRGT